MPASKPARSVNPYPLFGGRVQGVIRDLRPAVPRRAHPRPTATGRERLTEYALAADDLLVPRRHGVATLTINVPTAQPAQEADEILQAEQSLRERRADLDELAMLLPASIGDCAGGSPSLPAVIGRSIPPMRSLSGLPAARGDRLAQGLPGSARGPRRRALPNNLAC